MIGRVIRDYMEGGARKLTVPGFGTFMRRDGRDGDPAEARNDRNPSSAEARRSGGDSQETHSGKKNASGGDVIFVDLLRSDDGVLTELVEDYGPYSGVEAMAMIDRFIFETRTAIERTGSCAIAGFGTMTLDHNGLYVFDHSPRYRPRKDQRAVQERLFGPPDEDNEVNDGDAVDHLATNSRAASPERATPRPVQRPQPQPRTHKVSNVKKRKLKPDAIILVAIAAAVVAVAVLVFGASSGNMPFLNR
ncbi:MAG: hypothetical protein LBV18_00480 [Alistipes sp.]|jgi:nucleoid DNA-binding protein|nr:hypothetical protein [Alistipes sp.]